MDVTPRPPLSTTGPSIEFQRVARQAAAKGKAATLAYQAIWSLAHSGTSIQVDPKGKRAIYFEFPDKGVVFKKYNSVGIYDNGRKYRPVAEEETFSSLAELANISQAVVPTYHIRRASLYALKMSFNELNAYKRDELTNRMVSRIGESLSHADCDRLQRWYQDENPLRINYLALSQMQFHYQEFGQHPQKISFRKLWRLYSKDQIDSLTMIGLNSSPPQSFFELCLNDSPIIQALNYFPVIQERPEFKFLPLHDQLSAEKRSYCEKFLWRYDKGKVIDFRTLLLLSLKDDFKVSKVRSVWKNRDSDPPPFPTKKELKCALNVRWKVLYEDVIVYDEASNSKFILFNVSAQPLVKMYLLNELSLKQCNKMIARLTPESELVAIRIGELLPMDLSTRNLGLRFSRNDYQAFEKCDFMYQIGDELKIDSFDNFFKKYLEDSIPLETEISIFANQKRIAKGPLGEMENLRQVMEGPFEWTLFDVELSVGEDNLVNDSFEVDPKTKKGTNIKHLPLRWGLLGFDLKDSPLSDATLASLQNSREQDLRIFQWMERSDSPLKRRLSRPVLLEVATRTASLLDKLSLSNLYRKNFQDSIYVLQEEFAEELYQSNRKLWEILEAALKKDLTGNEESTIKRRLTYAYQLFPRLTNRQQSALVERLQRRTNYLFNYDALVRSERSGMELVEELRAYVSNIISPFNHFQKVDFLEQLDDRNIEKLLADKFALTQLKEEICSTSAPTIFNLLKVMYPLLADVYTLTEIAFPTLEPGFSIGFNLPIQKIIDEVKKKCIETSREYQLAERIETLVNEYKGAGFFHTDDVTLSAPATDAGASA